MGNIYIYILQKDTLTPLILYFTEYRHNRYNIIVIRYRCATEGIVM